ncbi:MAG TPA: alkaline phosphatase family protein [Ktedonobacteraceae bacterium]|nr:alkaline phosphatase family protein [Ktedonobacteraceae bacterium]
MRFVKMGVALMLLAVLLSLTTANEWTTVSAQQVSRPLPRYNHVLVIMEENHGYEQIIGNPAAPIINHLAQAYGLATNYTGVGDPSAPNYVGILGGSTFGIADDNPYYLHTINKPSLADQLENAGLTWKGYFGGLAYPGYKGICFPVKCDGAPDISPLYAAKHNGFPYFAHIQNNPQELQKMVPITQLDIDLKADHLPNFSFIVPDQCHDMHGAPPYCVDDGKPGSVTDNFLVSQGDAYIGTLVKKVMDSSIWSNGNNAIVITFDEGNNAQSRIVTIVIANHGSRGLRDSTPYNHYSLLLTIEKVFGLGCLQNACDSDTIRPMVLLFAS